MPWFHDLIGALLSHSPSYLVRGQRRRRGGSTAAAADLGQSPAHHTTYCRPDFCVTHLLSNPHRTRGDRGLGDPSHPLPSQVYGAHPSPLPTTKRCLSPVRIQELRARRPPQPPTTIPPKSYLTQSNPCRGENYPATSCPWLASFFLASAA